MGVLNSRPEFALASEAMYGILSDMKSVGTRELQHKTRSIRERVLLGESFLWKDRGKTVAIITPAVAQREPKPWPDLNGRLAGARENTNRQAPSASDIIYQERE
jgi:antitoxin (DNA-binding transcriptional repressor) of toxin-antitoxin stability system